MIAYDTINDAPFVFLHLVSVLPINVLVGHSSERAHYQLRA